MTHLSYWSHTTLILHVTHYPTGHTPIQLVILLIRPTHPSYCSPTDLTGYTPILMVTHPSYWSHTYIPNGHTPHPSYMSHTILMVTRPSNWSHTHHTDHTRILLVTHRFDWPHTNLNGHTPILLVTHPPS